MLKNMWSSKFMLSDTRTCFHSSVLVSHGSFQPKAGFPPGEFFRAKRKFSRRKSRNCSNSLFRRREKSRRKLSRLLELNCACLYSKKFASREKIRQVENRLKYAPKQALSNTCQCYIWLTDVQSEIQFVISQISGFVRGTLAAQTWSF